MNPVPISSRTKNIKALKNAGLDFSKFRIGGDSLAEGFAIEPDLNGDSQ
jgi:hypothetical protein